MSPQPVSLTIFDQSRHCLPAALRLDGDQILSCGANAYEMENDGILHDNFKLCIGNYEAVDSTNISRRYSHTEALTYTQKLLFTCLERLWEEKTNSMETSNLFCFTHPVHWLESKILDDFKCMVTSCFPAEKHVDIHFISEPEAAILSLRQTGQLNEVDGNILVIDIGGATTDFVTGLWTKERFQDVRNFGCDRGGSQIDHCLASHLAQQLKLPASRSARLNQQLRAYGRKFKEAISQQARVNYHQPIMLNVFLADEGDFHVRQVVTLTCEEFEQVVQESISDLKQAIAHALEKMQLATSDITQIVLVGGGARLYLLPNILREVFRVSVPIIYGDPPDSTVVRGAALHLVPAELEIVHDDPPIHDDPSPIDYKARGVARYHQRDYQGAIADFTKIITHEPDNVAAYMNRGAGHYQLQNYENAIKDWSQVVNMNPNDANASYQLGLGFMKQQEYNEAILNFNQALLVNPQLADAYLERGIAHYYLGRRNKAADDIKQAVQFSPKMVSDRLKDVKASIRGIVKSILPPRDKKETEGLIALVETLMGKGGSNEPEEDFPRLLLKTLARFVPEPEVIPVLTYRAVIEYFTTDRPPFSDIQGAILKQIHPKRKGYLIVQVFLDSNQELICREDGTPYGRKILVKNFDEELLESFHGKDLIIYK